jgi:beta-lactamase regulating signal transducer with metallopeptidase domain
MQDLAYTWINAALAHCVLSALMLAFAMLLRRVPAVSAEWRAGMLLGALLATVVLPWWPLVGAWWQAGELASVAVVAVDSQPIDSAGVLQIPPLWAMGLVALWCAGAVFCLLRLLHARNGLRQVIAMARPASIELHAGSGLSAQVQILLTHAFGPAATGVLRPRILIPHSLASTPGPALRAALLHEQAHLDRGDPAILWLQRLIEALCWWNPLLRRLTAELETAREVCCDLRAARHLGSRVEYADLLLDLVERRQPGPRLSVVPAMTSVDQLSARILQVLEGRRPASRMRQSWVLGGLVVTIVLSVVAQAAVPQIGPTVSGPKAEAAADAASRPWPLEREADEDAYQAAAEAAEARYTALREQAEAAYAAEREAAESRYTAERKRAEREYAEVLERQEADYQGLLEEQSRADSPRSDSTD